MDDFKVWGVVTLTVIVKLLLSPSQSLVRAVATVSSSFLAAMVFTEPTLLWLGLDREYYLIMVACFWGLAGENVLRRILDVLEDKELIIRLIERWSGKRDD